MPTEQLLQMPAVCTDCFSITGFATYTTKGRVMKQNLQTTESKTIVNYGWVGHYKQYTMHSAQFTTHYTQYTMHSAQFTTHYTQYTMYSAQFTTHYKQNTMHSAQFTTHYKQYTMRSAQFTTHYKQFVSLLSTFSCFAPFTSFNKNIIVVFAF